MCDEKVKTPAHSLFGGAVRQGLIDEQLLYKDSAPKAFTMPSLTLIPFIESSSVADRKILSLTSAAVR